MSSHTGSDRSGQRGTLDNEPQRPDPEFRPGQMPLRQLLRARQTQMQPMSQEFRARQEVCQQELRARQGRLQQLQQGLRTTGDQEVGNFEIQLARLHVELALRDVELARRNVQYARHLELAQQSDPSYIAFAPSAADLNLRQRMMSLQTLTFELEEETRHLLNPRTNPTGTYWTLRASGDGRVGNVQAPPYRASQTPPPTYEEASVSGSASTSREQQ